MQEHNQEQNRQLHVIGYGHMVVLHELVYWHCGAQQLDWLEHRVHTVRVRSLAIQAVLHYST